MLTRADTKVTLLWPVRGLNQSWFCPPRAQRQTRGAMLELTPACVPSPDSAVREPTIVISHMSARTSWTCVLSLATDSGASRLCRSVVAAAIAAHADRIYITVYFLMWARASPQGDENTLTRVVLHQFIIDRSESEYFIQQTTLSLTHNHFR